jgi:hypothetical protein
MSDDIRREGANSPAPCATGRRERARAGELLASVARARGRAALGAAVQPVAAAPSASPVAARWRAIPGFT